ncbi:hypothetical protein FEK35_06205 [Nocardia cyriacigeorgica]|uniref:Fenitrothion hydrolase n=1 Tax=Nocardia cyriacigeorgica TaxID=135487 RepID=A0A5R8PJ01_9NOCA|nr:hypothetical protein [Nocardia cyriacigeorgica]TLG15730.1 hypothetical protein FEK35_06205 [Nocardia cyriacigeorgica]
MTDVLAHGTSGATDLPIPLSYALIGAAWALTFSFAVLAFAWREPRLDPDSPGVRLFSFVWLELASPEPGSVLAVTIWFTGYLLIGTAGLFLFGTVWAERADPLEVYSSLLARLSPLARGADMALVLRWPLNNLAGTPALLGSVAVAATLLGSTAFDSFSMFPGWRDLLIDVGGDSALVTTLLRTAGLLGFILVVWSVFELATRATGGLSREQRARLPIQLAHSLTPIVAGYIIAHYLTFLVEKGQATLILCADPFGRGWNIAGLADLDVHYILSSHPSVLATLKVLAVLTGHILGVAAHDRCLRLLPPRHRLTGQLALMLVMVGFTFTGLYLLFEA